MNNSLKYTYTCFLVVYHTKQNKLQLHKKLIITKNSSGNKELYRSKNFSFIMTLTGDTDDSEGSSSVIRDSENPSTPTEHREYSR